MPMKNEPLILALDIGTSSTRAMLFDAHARPVANLAVQMAIQMETTSNGGATFDANYLFACVVATVDELLERAGPLAGRIAAVTCDTFVGNVLGANADDEPVTPVFTYADTRNAPDAQQLREELGPAGSAVAHDRTGTLIHTSYLPARFRWLARTQPEALRAARYWLSFGEFLLWKLTRQRVASYSVASWSGLLNRRSLSWDAEWLERLPVTVEQLSPLIDVDQPLVGLTTPWAGRWPALKSVPWLPAIGDGAAANLGSGCDHPDRIALTVGTTGAMRVVLDPALDRVPAGLWLYRVDRHRGLLGGATTEGGNLYAWLQENLRLPPAAELEQQLAALPPAAHGLTVLPFVAGERAPGWNDKAKASLIGFNLNTQPIDIVQASLEGIAYRFALIYERIAGHLPPSATRSIIASGGGLLSSPVWLQIFADVLDQPILALDEKEITSRGIALLGLEQIGAIRRMADLPPATGQTYLPNAAAHTAHTAAIERQVQFYEQFYG
ncbi:MAG: carbohydrate kinase [Chloroflexi bacterium]|nr:MAG: carbohydrate kinase [Chloroflexota bacterium]